jgi:hypothetical protein
MARQDLAIQIPVAAGIIPTWTTATVDGLMYVNDGQTHIHVKNGNGATLTVTVQTPATFEGLAVSDRTITILTTAEKEFIVSTNYNQPASSADAGKVYLDFSVQSSVLVKATHH